MNRTALNAFLDAARALGDVDIRYQAPVVDGQHPIIAIDARTREAAIAVAEALRMPVPREVSYNGARWLASALVEDDLFLDVRSTPEEVGETADLEQEMVQ